MMKRSLPYIFVLAACVLAYLFGAMGTETSVESPQAFRNFDSSADQLSEQRSNQAQTKPHTRQSNASSMTNSGVLYGIVVDGKNQPVVDATITFRGEKTNNAPLVLLTDSTGRFSVDESLLLHAVEIHVRKDKYSDWRSNLVNAPRNSSNGITVVLDLLCSLSGHVEHASALASSEVRVGLFPKDISPITPNSSFIGGYMRLMNNAAYSCAVSPSGLYELANIPSGVYDVLCGYDDVAILRADVKLKNHRANVLDFDLTNGGEVSGTVQSQDGEGLANVTLAIYPFVRKRDASGFLIGEKDEIIRSTVTDSNGSFLLEDVPAGSYLVRLQNEQQSDSSEFLMQRSFDLAVGQRLTKNVVFMNQRSGATLQGLATLDGVPAYTTLILFAPDQKQSVHTQEVRADGTFEVHGIQLGRYYLWFIDPPSCLVGIPQAVRELLEVPSNEAHIVVDCRRTSAKLTGQLSSVVAGSLSSVAITLVPKLEAPWGKDWGLEIFFGPRLFPSEQGDFQIATLSTGAYTISAARGHSKEVAQTLDVYGAHHCILQLKE